MENEFILWAQSQPGLRAAIAVGSRARTDPPPDEWSDLDLMLFLDDIGSFNVQETWLDDIGEVWNAVHNTTAGGDPEWLVTFAGGYNIDLVMLNVDALRWLVTANPLPDPFIRGYRVLVDKDGLARQLPPPYSKPLAPPQPTREEFDRTVRAFWYVAFYIAKQLRRGDLFMVKVRDGAVKECLLTMLTWHALVVRGAGAEIWHMGRFMDQWADPQAVQDLPAIFAHYDAPDSWRALQVSMSLFRRLACETANALGYHYPALIDEHFTDLVNALMEKPDAG